MAAQVEGDPPPTQQQMNATLGHAVGGNAMYMLVLHMINMNCDDPHGHALLCDTFKNAIKENANMVDMLVSEMLGGPRYVGEYFDESMFSHNTDASTRRHMSHMVFDKLSAWHKYDMIGRGESEDYTHQTSWTIQNLTVDAWIDLGFVDEDVNSLEL